MLTLLKSSKITRTNKKKRNLINLAHFKNLKKKKKIENKPYENGKRANEICKNINKLNFIFFPLFFSFKLKNEW